MIVKPRIRGFICTTAHPDGCAKHVQQQTEYVEQQTPITGPKKALVIGSSTGYGLASRIVATFGAGADTIGIFFEKPASDNRTGTAGWYNTAAFEQLAREAGHAAWNINGDAFSEEVKEKTIELIRREFGQVDLVVYSLASPRRTHPRTGESFSSVIKPIGQTFTSKTVDVHTGKVSEITIDPATEEEVRQTVAVMGGEDWKMWMDALDGAGVLADNVTTIAYSYIGPELTYPIYREGTIGKAKDDLERTAQQLNESLGKRGGRAFISVNKALVTQSSSAIPVVPLYISLLYKVMKEQGSHEGCVEQMYRLFAERLYTTGEVPLDSQGRIRIDDLEMRDDVQAAVMELWGQINSDNLLSLADVEGYRNEFLHLFGFGFSNVPYDRETDIELAPSLIK